MNINGDQGPTRDLPTVSTVSTGGDRDLSSPPSHGANINTDYALLTTDNKNSNKDITSIHSPLPSDLQYANQNRIGTPQFESSTRVELSAGGEPPYFVFGHVEGFIVSKHCCSPSHHLYPKFVDFPTWSWAVACPTNNNKPPQSLLLSSIDDQTWKEFETAFSDGLKTGYRNLLIFQFIAVLSTFPLTTVLAGKIDPLLFFFFLVAGFVIIYEVLRPSLFDKIDAVAAGFQARFAEKGIRISVAYYSVNRGKMTASSRYLIFTALPHPRTINLL